MNKVERLVNLLILLLETSRPLTADEIRERIPGYAGQGKDAFRRMFERDKGELRALGLPLSLEPADVWDHDEGYRIPRDEALLDDPGLTPDEQAALFVAASAWGGETPGGGAATALLKLAAAGGADPSHRPAILPHIDLTEPALQPLFDAILARKRVSFAYRTGGGGAPAERRTIEPWGLRYRAGWYVTGFDHDRGEERMFKLARIDGPVEVSAGKAPEFDPPAASTGAPRGPWEGEAAETARVAFSPSSAWWAERLTGASRVAERPNGWAEFELPLPDTERFAAWIAGFADEALVVSPPALRDAVVARLRALAEA